MWDIASEETVTSFLRWAIQANCTQLHDKCMSLLEQIFPHGILTYDWAVVCSDHPEFCTIFIEDYLNGCTKLPYSFNVLFKCF
jgi:hypothetical protein